MASKDLEGLYEKCEQKLGTLWFKLRYAISIMDVKIWSDFIRSSGGH